MHVVGARPNFVKTAPVVAEMARYPKYFRQMLVHTGQHYDNNMSRVFFDELDIPRPDVFLDVGSGTHAEQTARIMLAFEPIVLKHRPDWVIVVGDVNSTLACSLVCAKLEIPVAHVEAGLRSGNRTMPEEINRLLTDQIADLLFTPSKDADENLVKEGIPPTKIHFVGNVMIDTLVRLLPKARESRILAELALEPNGFVLVTLHRPSNVDDPQTLGEILTGLAELVKERPVVFPVHPRTRKCMEKLAIDLSRVSLIEPLGYIEFLALMASAKLVITDSGGVQEETTYLGIPCLTVRPNTERPVTIHVGTNRLVESRAQAIVDAVQDLDGVGSAKLTATRPRRPDLWDGRTAHRIVQIMMAQELD